MSEIIETQHLFQKLRINKSAKRNIISLKILDSMKYKKKYKYYNQKMCDKNPVTTIIDNKKKSVLRKDLLLDDIINKTSTTLYQTNRWKLNSYYPKDKLYKINNDYKNLKLVTNTTKNESPIKDILIDGGTLRLPSIKSKFSRNLIIYANSVKERSQSKYKNASSYGL